MKRLQTLFNLFGKFLPTRSRRQPAWFRPQLLVLEERTLPTIVLSSQSSLFSYVGVGLQENLVAGLNGVFNGQEDLHASDYQVQINWGDSNQWTTASLVLNSQNSGEPFLVKGSHIYTTANNDYTIQVRATGPDGITVTQTTCSAEAAQMPSGIAGIAPNTINNLQPPSNVQVVLSTESTLDSYAGVGFQENLVSALSGSLNNQADVTITDYHVQINYGDSNQWFPANLAPNSGSSQPFLIKGSHIYAHTGTYPIVVFAQGPDGTSTTLASTEEIVAPMPSGIPGIAPNTISNLQPPSDVQLVLSTESSLDATAEVNTGMQVVSSVHGVLNGQADLTLSDYHAQINWGDSATWTTATVASNTTGSSNDPFAIEGSHTYATAGTYPLVVFVQGPDGTSVSIAPTEVIVSANPNPPTFSLSGTTLTVNGSLANETFTFSAGANEQITLNGTPYPINPAVVSTIHFTGKGGQDKATLTGTGADYAGLLPTDATLRGNGYTVDAQNCVSVTINAGGSNATADFGTTTGADSYIGTPTYSAAIGSGYANYAVGFANAFGYANGTNAIAYLKTSTGNDTFGGLPTYSFVQGSNYDSYAIGFAVVAAYAGGPKSVAYMATSASPDSYLGTPTYSEVTGASYASYGIGFALVEAWAGGTQSVAFLSTSTGNDFFAGHSTYSEATNTTSYTNYAIGFANVSATAGSSNSSADLYASSANDTFQGSGATALLSGPASSYNVEGTDFGAVNIYSSTPGTNHEYLAAYDYALGQYGNWV